MRLGVISGRMLVELAEWWAASLTPADREFMQSFAPTLGVRVGEVDVLYFHGSPRSHDDQIYATTPDEELRPMLNGFEAPVFVGGHTHAQMVRRVDERLIFNPGASASPSASGGRARSRSRPGPNTAC